MIYINNLTKRFGETIIYKDTSYSFKSKSLTCFFGPSGSGKTTLFNILAGFDTDYKGDIIIKDKILNDLNKEKLIKYRFNDIGFVFQGYHLIKGYTALENVLMASDLNSKYSDEKKKEKALNILESLNLSNEINQKVETLSGGQKQRVAIARALINDPSIILADEPTGALDDESTENIMNILKDISKSKTVIVITHDDDVLNYADEVIKLEDNKIVTVKENVNKDIKHIKEEKWTNPCINKKTVNKLSIKNFKLNFIKYILAAIIIAFSTATFIASFSANEIGNKVFNNFKEKNSFYNIGQIPKYFNGQVVNDDLKGVKDKLLEFNEIENVYYQYDIKDVSIKLSDKEVNIPIKGPSALSNESLSYGNMPKEGENEIAISASVVNRIVNNIQDIIGEKIMLEYLDKNESTKEIQLEVTGVTNSSYQDFIVSSNIEKDIYKDMGLSDDDATAISFTVKDFEKIPQVEKNMRNDNINVLTKGNEIEAFLDTFANLTKLFMFLSYIVIIIGLAVSLIILYKINSSRESEFAILSAIGYKDSFIKRILFKENVVFSLVSILLSFVLVGVLNILSIKTLGYGLTINLASVVSLIFINLFITLGLSFIINNKLLKKDKILSLR